MTKIDRVFQKAEGHEQMINHSIKNRKFKAQESIVYWEYLKVSVT